MTQFYAEVIGDPIAQSKSPMIHLHWLAELGLEGDYRHAHVRHADLADYLANRRKDEHWRGCNVTMPHKLSVIPLLDRLDDVARAVGAVNTIVRESDGSLTGYNTDVPGFLEPIRALGGELPLGGHAIVLGAGGAARAVVYGLWQAGYSIDILNRDPAKAQALAEEFGAPTTVGAALTLPARPRFSVADGQPAAQALLVNTTALGMGGQPPLDLSLDAVEGPVTVYDIITSPLETPLLKEARARGLTTVDGLSMLIGQAAVAFEHFFGAAPLRADGDAALRAVLTETQPA
jgi:shikimate dehydrogenase